MTAKIIHIVRDNFTPNSLNGVYKVVDSLSCALGKQLGKQKVCVCSVSPLFHNEIYQSEFYEHIQYLEHSLKFFLTKDFKDFLLSQPKDCVFHFHSVFIPWFLNAVKLLKDNGYNRIVLTPHGQYVDEAMKCSIKKKVFFHFFDRRVIKMVDVVHVIGHTEINSYIRNNANDYQLIPNGGPQIQIINFSARQKLVYGYLGRLDIQQKGLDVLMRAFAFYKKQGGKGILKIAGDGSDKESLEKLCQTLGMQSYVKFIGKVFGNEKLTFYKRCSWFVHPSRWDGLPTSCLEAASCGIPLIVSRETNLDTYIEKYKAGIIIEADDRPIQALADSFFKAERTYDEKSYLEVRKNVQNMISQDLNWTHIANIDLKLLYKQ